MSSLVHVPSRSGCPHAVRGAFQFGLVRLAAFDSADPAACVVFEQYRLPMRLRLYADARALLQELAQRPPHERSLAALQQRLRARELPVAEHERAELGNVNTPEEWQQAVRA